MSPFRCCLNLILSLWIADLSCRAFCFLNPSDAVTYTSVKYRRGELYLGPQGPDF